MNWSWKRKLSLGALVVVMLVGAVLAASGIRAKAGDWAGTFWAGTEVQLDNGKVGSYVGNEGYICLLDKLFVDGRFNGSFYDTNYLDAALGLRAVFPRYSFGVCLGANDYDFSNPVHQCLVKFGFWGSAYGPGLFGKAYIEKTFAGDYYKISFSIDWRGKPIGFAESQIFNYGPGGMYKELRGDVSLSLFYPCSTCVNDEYDCDFRGYSGGRLASFDSSTYHGNWKGWYIGLRLIIFNVSATLELQNNFKTDAWTKDSPEWKVLMGVTLSLPPIKQ